MLKARTNRNRARFLWRSAPNVFHLKNSFWIVSRGARRPETSQKLPPTAIYCHFVAAEPSRSLQPFQSSLYLDDGISLRESLTCDSKS